MAFHPMSSCGGIRVRSRSDVIPCFRLPWRAFYEKGWFCKAQRGGPGPPPVAPRPLFYPHSATSDAVASWCMLRSGTRRWLPTPRRSRERNKARLAVHRDEVWGDRRHTDHDETLGCAPGEQVIGIVDGATDPELMEQDGQFAGHGHDRSFLGILPAAPGDPLAVSSQVTRRAK